MFGERLVILKLIFFFYNILNIKIRLFFMQRMLTPTISKYRNFFVFAREGLGSVRKV
jgi:hypothetical protein